MHQTLLKYTKQAFDLKLKGVSSSNASQEKAVKKLISRVEENKNKVDFSWLMERVNELLAE